MTKKELEKLLKEYIEENNLTEIKVNIYKLGGNKKKVEVKER